MKITLKSAILVLSIFCILALLACKKEAPPPPPLSPAAALSQMLLHPDEHVREDAATRLGTMGAAAKEAIPMLITSLNDREAQVRTVTATALGKLGDDRAVSPLTGCLTDTSVPVRARCAEALGLFKESANEAVPGLVFLLDDEFTDVRFEVARALGSIGAGAKPAVLPLIEALEDRDEKVRRAAVQALIKLGPTSEDEVIVALKEGSFAVRDFAAEILTAIGSPKAMAALKGN